ncbi:hypothetical protein BS78_08G091500 [Paspalum vaginatum]|nr:hypothetical protein BS78_08G091500 [Paspalum vaginatum]KAJ1265634.1 hypothetical protein BS78_08G091500 [Paspalum vaginatum]KAJ1265635.1 hypothetical protein BS78_08G091500 [Paspalum vaginatum]
MDPLVSVDDKGWFEVDMINSYAVFMGYLLMGVRGLGLLVLTWTTVVLLGGFVTMLQKKDFWCLTVITLVQTAGVFDFLLKEKARDTVESLNGLLAATGAAVLRPFKKDKENKDDKSVSKLEEDIRPSTARFALAYFLLFVQMLVLAIVVCILAVLYILGLCISTGSSLWRLVQHDYGGSNNTDGGTNLKPALNVLYSLALAQGVLYGYRTMYAWLARTGLVEDVAAKYSLETDIVSGYLDETLTGCTKDASFARGRNLITYGVGLLMEPKTRYGYISGVLILGKALQPNRFVWARRGQRGLIKQLLTGSATFNHVVQRLVETFGPRSPYNTEIKECAAWIVANVAGCIHLRQFPEGMMTQCLSALVDTYQEYSWRPEGYERISHVPKECERDWLLEDPETDRDYLDVDRIPTQKGDGGNLVQGYKSLLVQGMRILQRLAINEDNCKLISSTEALVYKTMEPLTWDQFHKDHHDEWSSIAEESLKLIKRLMATPAVGETKTKLISEISGISQAIISTLECDKCELWVKRLSVQVLLDLSVDTSSIVNRGSSSSSKIFICVLLHIYLLPNYILDEMRGSVHLVKKSSDLRRLAGERLLASLPAAGQNQIEEARGERSMHEAVRVAVRSLTSGVIDGAQDNAYRRHAATTMRDLFCYYSKDGEYLKELKKAATDVIPALLKEILCWLKRQEIQAVTKSNNSDQIPDLEQGGVWHGNGEPSSSDDVKMRLAFMALCNRTYCRDDCVIVGDEDSTHTRSFDNIVAQICSEQGMPVRTYGSLQHQAVHTLLKEMDRFKTGAQPVNS